MNDVIVAAAGGTPDGDIGGMQDCSSPPGLGYLVGGLVFGIALFRSGVLARWAAALLAVGHRRHRRARRAAGVVQPAVRRPGGRRAHRPGRLPVAQPRDADRAARVRRPSAPQSDEHAGRDRPRTLTAGATGPSAGLPAGRSRRPSRAERLVPSCSPQARSGWSSSPADPRLIPADARFAGLPAAAGRPHRRRRGLRPGRGRSSSPAGLRRRHLDLAPARRPGPRGRGPAGRRRLGAVDDADLPPQAGHRRPALRVPAGVRLRDGRPWSSGSPPSVAATSPRTAPG